MNARNIEAARGKEIPRREIAKAKDAVLAMLGVGKELWEFEPGDSFVERLRSEDLTAPPSVQLSPAPAEILDAVWQRVAAHAGEQFQAVRGLPFTFEVEGSGIWFFRDGKRINRKLTRPQFGVAVSRCPLRSTTEIKDLMDYPYLFALLMDERIRAQAW